MLLLSARRGEHQHDGARLRRADRIDGRAHVRQRARIDRQHLGALAARHGGERGLERFDRAYGGLAAERLAQLE